MRAAYAGTWQAELQCKRRHTASVKDFDLAAGCPGRMLAIGDLQTETTPASAKTCVACHFRPRVSSADYEEQTLQVVEFGRHAGLDCAVGCRQAAVEAAGHHAKGRELAQVFSLYAASSIHFALSARPLVRFAATVAAAMLFGPDRDCRKPDQQRARGCAATMRAMDWLASTSARVTAPFDQDPF